MENSLQLAFFTVEKLIASWRSCYWDCDGVFELCDNLRFPCCGRVFACDLRHNDAETGHEMKLANRMICGFCSKEQVLFKFKNMDTWMLTKRIFYLFFGP